LRQRTHLCLLGLHPRHGTRLRSRGEAVGRPCGGQARRAVRCQAVSLATAGTERGRLGVAARTMAKSHTYCSGLRCEAGALGQGSHHGARLWKTTEVCIDASQRRHPSACPRSPWHGSWSLGVRLRLCCGHAALRCNAARGAARAVPPTASRGSLLLVPCLRAPLNGALYRAQRARTTGRSRHRRRPAS
jgi:hypothetical protein